MMTKKLNLGVLDFCSVPPKKTNKYALHTTIELACRAEALGYSRYWLAEHHGNAAHASPELLIPLIAGLTKKIRIGTAGILLYFYSPLKIAENFKLLETLFEGRIDLGVCRGGAVPYLAQALLDGRTRNLDLELYQEKVERLIKYLRGSSNLQSLSPDISIPEVWILGSGWNSVPTAANNGLAYSYSLFHKGFQDNPDILKTYQESFEAKSNIISVSLNNIAVAGICAETEAKADRLLEQHNNEFIVPSVVGNPRQCKNKLLELQERYGVDEIIFLDLCQEFEDRLHSYELLATELGLMNSALQKTTTTELSTIV